MKLLKGKQQVKPVSTGAEVKPILVDYNNYDISTTPLLDEEGNRFFYVDNPLTRTEKNLHNISLGGANLSHYRSLLESSRMWLHENAEAITAKFIRVELPIEDVINKMSLSGLYRMATSQIDRVLDTPQSILKADEKQFIKKRDIYEGVTPYAFQNAVTGYYKGENYELLEQKIDRVIGLGYYPEEWYNIDIRCKRTLKREDRIRKEIRTKLSERYIHTYDGDTHYMNLCASLLAGLETVPVEIYYHGGCEKNAIGIWNPNTILNMYARHLVDSQEVGV